MKFFIFFLLCLFFYSNSYGQSDLQKYCVEGSTDFEKVFDGILGKPSTNMKFVYMKAPDEASEEDIEGYSLEYNQPGIFIGAMPDNFNGTVLGIHPGSTVKFQAESLFSKQDIFGSSTIGIYNYFHSKGYAVAFFATSAFLGDFYNGYISSLGIEELTNHFGIDKISIASYSGGGPVLETAALCYNKIDNLDRVYAIGSPFFGTELIDLALLLPEFAQITASYVAGFANGLGGNANLINEVGPNNFYSQSTFYKKSIFRPFMDSHKNNKPEIFYLAGSSNYLDFSDSSFLNLQLNFAMAFTGSIMSVMSISNDEAEFGSNDGIVSTYSYKRPGGIIYDEFEDLNMHHMNIANHRKPVAHETLHNLIERSKFNDNVSPLKIINRRNKSIVNEKSRNITVRSNYQVSDIGSFRLDENSNQDEATILSINENTIQELNDAFEQENKVNNNARIINKRNEDIVKDILFRKYKVDDKVKNNFRISNQNTTEVTGVDFLIQEGIEIELTADYSQSVFDYSQNPYPILVLDVISDKEINKNSLIVNAIATKQTNIYGEKQKEELQSINLTFSYNAQKNVFEAETLGQDLGLYTIKIRVKNEEFQRDILGGYTVGNLFESIDLNEEKQLETKSRINLSSKSGLMTINQSDVFLKTKAPILVKFFDARGRYFGQIYRKETGSDILTLNLNDSKISIQKGQIYFVTAIKGDKVEGYKVKSH